MSKKSTLGMLAMFAAMASLFEQPTVRRRREPIHIEPKEKPIPRGCKEYWFSENGMHSTQQMSKLETVFTCVASNDKNAIRKFKSWKAKSH